MLKKSWVPTGIFHRIGRVYQKRHVWISSITNQLFCTVHESLPSTEWIHWAVLPAESRSTETSPWPGQSRRSLQSSPHGEKYLAAELRKSLCVKKGKLILNCFSNFNYWIKYENKNIIQSSPPKCFGNTETLLYMTDKILH